SRTFSRQVLAASFVLLKAHQSELSKPPARRPCSRPRSLVRIQETTFMAANWFRTLLPRLFARHAQQRRPRRRPPVPLRLEVLEARPPPAVQFTYGGPTTNLVLAEMTSEALTVVLSEPAAGLLKIDLGSGNTFAGASTTSVTGLTYQTGSAATSQFAT